MKKALNLFLIGLLCTSIACTDNDDPTPGTSSLNMNLSLGKNHVELPVKMVKAENALYVVGTAQTEFPKKENDHDDFHGGFHDIFVTKISLTGDTLWQKCYGTTRCDIPNNAFMVEDDLIVTGHSMYYGSGSSGYSYGLHSEVALILRIKPDGSQKFLKESIDDIFFPQIGEKIVASTKTDNKIVLIQQYNRHKTYARTASFDGVLDEPILLNFGEHVVGDFVSLKKTDSGYLLIGESDKKMAFFELNEDFTTKAVHRYGTTGGSIAYDVVETNDGYLMVGETNGITTKIGSYTYSVVNDPWKNRAREWFIVKTDENGAFNINKQWQIGFGYLESGFAGEYEIEYQPDFARKIVKLDEEQYLVLGQGCYHSNGNGVIGAGASGIAKLAGMSCKIKHNYQPTNETNAPYFVWKDQFYKHVLQSKKLLKDFEYIYDAIKVNNEYVLMGYKDKNIIVKSFALSEL